MRSEFSKILEDSEVSIKLYSKFPFPNRKDRVLDNFQNKAWEILTKNPDTVFTNSEKINGREVVRVAIADKMTQTGCVSCHNTHIESPKTDWKLGDVRGVLEVNSIIDKQIAASYNLSNKLIISIIVSGSTLIILLIITKTISTPITKIATAMRELANGKLEVKIPDLSRKDEIGNIAQAVNVFKKQGAENKLLNEEALEREQHTNKINKEIKEFASEFKNKIENSFGKLAQMSTRMKLSAEKMQEFAKTTNDEADDMKKGVEAANICAQHVESLAKELASSVDAVNSQTIQSSELIYNAVQSTISADDQVKQLTKATNEIEEIIFLINPDSG